MAFLLIITYGRTTASLVFVVYTVSIIVPIFNEAKWLPTVLDRLANAPVLNWPVQVVLVDDASTDDSVATMQNWLQAHHSNRSPNPIQWTLMQHTHNQGKGQAIRTGLTACTGSIILIHDADLEYDPNDFDHLLTAMETHQADVVYGSRLHPASLPTNRPSFNTLFYLGNRLLTWVTNLLYATRLTDMETCYKAFRANIIHQLPLTANGFDIEPELTALLARRNIPIIEVPIAYKGRKNKEGKKIRMKDGLTALATLVKYRF
jgi:glycosyltransferase involved in cell wall biosynthesis